MPQLAPPSFETRQAERPIRSARHAAWARRESPVRYDLLALRRCRCSRCSMDARHPFGRGNPGRWVRHLKSHEPMVGRIHCIFRGQVRSEDTRIRPQSGHACGRDPDERRLRGHVGVGDVAHHGRRTSHPVPALGRPRSVQARRQQLAEPTGRLDLSSRSFGANAAIHQIRALFPREKRRPAKRSDSRLERPSAGRLSGDVRHPASPGRQAGRIPPLRSGGVPV